MFSGVLENYFIIPFLEVLFDHTNKFLTFVYWKPTFIEIFTNFDSFIR